MHLDVDTLRVNSFTSTHKYILDNFLLIKKKVVITATRIKWNNLLEDRSPY